MNTGDKTKMVGVRMSEEMYEWVEKQRKECELRSPGDFLRTLIRIGMSFEERQKQVVEALEDVGQIVKEEQNRK